MEFLLLILAVLIGLAVLDATAVEVGVDSASTSTIRTRRSTAPTDLRAFPLGEASLPSPSSPTRAR